VRHEAVLNTDKTGHRTNGDKRWLWTFVARTFVVYRIAASRGSDVLNAVLRATFAGILGSDRLPRYLKYVAEQRQFCWAHVTRNLLSALELATTPSAKRFSGSGISTPTTTMSGTWRRRSSCTISISSPSCTSRRGPHQQRLRARPSNGGAMEKIMFGTGSEQGERAVERLLTIVRTCQLRELNALVYLTAATAAHRRRHLPESLLRRTQTP
jgi:hypothetical protein